MARRIRKATRTEDAGYPSLKEHVMSRRRFLELAGTSLAATGLMAACGRALGGSDSDGGVDPDAEILPDGHIHQPDGDIEILGDIEEPDYFILRIPETGDLTSYLVDGGYCMFFVKVATYNADSYDALRDNPSRAQQVCRETIADFTYDTLNTSQGVLQAEDDLLSALDELCQELNGHSSPTLEAATLHITYLDSQLHMDGGMPEPSYP
jgi:hypothetical protein